MKTFRLTFPSQKKSCNLHIGRGLLKRVPGVLAGMELAEVYLLLTDRRVGKLYGNALFNSLKKRGISCRKLAVPPGEGSKSREIKELVEDRMIEDRFGRDSALLALGGGVVGDLGGFVASTYMRGIPYVQIPTTLLSMVDSSVGGKTAINHPSGKNLIGSFHQPEAILMDVDTLLTLPKREFRCGLAEAIKYGVALDESLFDLIEENADAIVCIDLDLVERIVSRCARLKGEVVQKDEKEKGLRKILNFGHTVAHSLELLSSYRIRHGEAVSIGMLVEGEISRRMGLLNDCSLQRVRDLLRSFSLPVSVPAAFSTRDLIEISRRDKKIRRGRIECVLIGGIGKPADRRKITFPVDEMLILEALKACS
ncbi:MAG: 3-dehydroquinate synthase [Acidobacteriota bacterium]